MSGASSSSQFQRLKVEDALSYLDQVDTESTYSTVGDILGRFLVRLPLAKAQLYTVVNTTQHPQYIVCIFILAIHTVRNNHSIIHIVCKTCLHAFYFTVFPLRYLYCCA